METGKGWRVVGRRPIRTERGGRRDIAGTAGIVA